MWWAEPREAKFFERGLVVEHNFHRAVGREAQALVIKRCVDALIEETGIEVSLFFRAQPPIGIIEENIQISQAIVQLIESLVILITHNQREGASPAARLAFTLSRMSL